VRELGLEEVFPRVAEIVADVRTRGDDALLDWSEQLDGERPKALRVPAAELEDARLDDRSLRAIRTLAQAVEAVHAPQQPPDTTVSAVSGIVSERRFLPLDSVGICVPGGRAPLVSSLVMAAVPARLAGVRRIAVVSPRPHRAVLATARELGLDEVYAIGGAHAVAALAYGTDSVQSVDKIVGPGSRWVTAAKLLVSSRLAIDLPAGPSEVVVVADEGADPVVCAADLLAQAEHGPDSEAILVTTSTVVADAVAAICDGRARVEVVGSLAAALARANEYAPEHLELLVADPDAAAAEVVNAGSVFLGTTAVVGDYAAGANHVLPTGGLARGAGGLGLEDFLKPVQFVRATPEGLAAVRETVEALSRLEGLPLHAASVAARAGDVDSVESPIAEVPALPAPERE
jgi:histidinol dehydrogenase